MDVFTTIITSPMKDLSANQANLTVDQLVLVAKIGQVVNALPIVLKTDANPYYESVYAGLPSILNTLMPALKEEGLALLQHFEGLDGNIARIVNIIVETSSGVSISFPTNFIAPDKLDPQKLGSLITYARRYSIQSLFSMIADDDDGNAASGRDRTSQASPKAPTSAPKPTAQQSAPAPQKQGTDAFTTNDFADLVDYGQSLGVLDIKPILKAAGITGSHLMKKSEMGTYKMLIEQAAQSQ